MKRIIALALILLPATAAAQATGSPQSLPLVVDLKKAPVGSWAEYGMNFGEVKMKSRWALVARNASSTTLEMSMLGAMAVQMGGKITLKMVLDLDPIGAANPVKEWSCRSVTATRCKRRPMCRSRSSRNPMPRPWWARKPSRWRRAHFRPPLPRPHAGGHGRRLGERRCPPLGLIKVVTTPEPKSGGADSPSIPPATMELTGTGTGAKPTITKRAKPFDPKGMTAGAPRAGKKHK